MTKQLHDLHCVDDCLDFEGFFVVVVVVFLCNRSTLAYASVAKENEWVTI